MSKICYDSRFIGGILLIVGTSIGGGMLALPVANAATGFWLSSLFLLACWAIMTLGALFILEISLYLPRGTHMVSMAFATLGTSGLVIAWLSYLFLLYTLLSGYLSGGADVLASLLIPLGIPIASWQSSILFTLLFGIIVYGGIRRVDLINRALMFTKLGVYILLVVFISPHIQLQHLHIGEISAMTSTVMILITSFGFAIIIPNLRDYFDDDVHTLRQVVLIGSLIPLLCYIAWDLVILGSLPANELSALMHSEHTTSTLARILSITVGSTFIHSFFNLFTSVCMLTAFLGVALCLITFLADGLKVEQKGAMGFLLFLLTFLPPLLIVMFYPGAYIHALNYAGLFCVILLLLLPAFMTLFGRARFSSPFQVPGGHYSQGLVIICSAGLIMNSLWPILTSAS